MHKFRQSHQTAMIIGTVAILAGVAMGIYTGNWRNNGITIFLGICLLGAGWINSEKSEDGD